MLPAFKQIWSRGVTVVNLAMCVALLYLGCLALIYRASEPQKNFKEDFLLWNRNLLELVGGIVMLAFDLLVAAWTPLRTVVVALCLGVWAAVTRKRSIKFWTLVGSAALLIVGCSLPPEWRTACLNGAFTFVSRVGPVILDGIAYGIVAVFMVLFLWVYCYAPTPKRYVHYFRSFEGEEWTLRTRFEFAVNVRYLLIPALIIMVSTDDGFSLALIGERLMSYAPFVLPFGLIDLWLAAKLRREGASENSSAPSPGLAD